MFHQPIVVVKSPDSPDEPYEIALQGFENRRTCKGAVDALQLLENTPAPVVIAESDMEEMSGIEIAEAIRDIDAERDHFTFLILVGPALSADIQDAFSSHVDAFVNHGDTAMLRTFVLSGIRIAQHINTLADKNSALLAEQELLRKGQLLDPVTGLGNRRFAEQSLSDITRQVESRGGAICLVMIAVANYENVLAEYDEHIAGELMKAIAERLEHLVRPMDFVAYFAPGQFALVLLQSTLEQCTEECYQRIFDGVALKSFKTAVGFLPANIGMSICASGAETGAPNPQTMIERAEANLPTALQKQQIVVEHLGVSQN